MMSVLVVDRGMTFEQIANCTDDQLARIIFFPRDDEGKIKPGALDDDRIGGEPVSFREACYRIWRMRDPGMTDRELEDMFIRNYPGAS